jgi:hypothetical protein
MNDCLYDTFPIDDYPLQNLKLVAENLDTDTALVEDGGRYYIWITLTGGVFRVDEPKNLSDILKGLEGEDHEWKIQTTALEVVPQPGDEEIELDSFSMTIREENEMIAMSSGGRVTSQSAVRQEL